MSRESAPFRCSRCGRSVPEGHPDPRGWCASCRAGLVRRAGAWAWLPATGVGLLYAALLFWSGLVESTLLVFWIALGAVLVWVAYKVARRVFFEAFRNRADVA